MNPAADTPEIAAVPIVEYDSNNSGGGWWLNESDWLALEKAGWEIEWGSSYFCHSDSSWNKPPAGKPEPCKATKDCPGHRRFDSLDEAKASGEKSWLGAWAKGAVRRGLTLADAILEWEKVTGKDATDEGCNCCGAPHSFSEKGGSYASGEDIVGVLYGENAPRSLREAAERLDGRRR